MSKLEKLKEKAKSLEAKDPKAAIESWLEILQVQEDEGEPNPDLSVYNRIGDLYLKVKDPGQAADYYERAVDHYAELGFHNNAIAMCNKVLRNAPARQNTYLKLAKLYASKGFLAEAKQHFVEYAERMHKTGKIQQAFSALKEFTDLTPDSAGLRAMLEEQLQMYGTPDRRSSVSVPTPAAPPKDDLHKSGKRKSSSLVFLDLDEPKPKAKSPLPPSLLTEVTPEPDTSLEIETTSLAEEDVAPEADELIEGFERTVDFGETQALAPEAPSLRDELPTDDIEPMVDLEPTMEVSDIEPIEVEPVEEVEEIEEPPPPPPRPRVAVPKVPPPQAPAPRPGVPRVAPVVPRRPGAPAPRVTAPAPEPPRVKPVVPKRPAAAPPPPGKRKTIVEVPLLELEPDFATETTSAGHDVDDEPLTVDEARPDTSFIRTEDDTSVAPGRRSGYVDVGLDGVINQSGASGSLVFANIEDAPSAPPIEQLEALVADDPDDPEAHRALGEALIESGARDRGIQELDHATGGFENRGDLERARGLVEEILRLDPNSVRHRQKQVEYAFKTGDKTSLIDAYLELADTLLRGDLPDKARAVYQRVAEHDRGNERALAALAMLAPAGARPPQPRPREKAPPPRVPAKDAKPRAREEAVVEEAAEESEFIDLGAMILDDDRPVRDTRMKVADEEPTGDEEKDFRDMLSRFKQGIDENIDEADFQSHYDLGVAFKEMGLLDEAISEFQKALRAPDGKLKTSEALGACFLEKGALVVAESILRRGLDLPAGGDQERVGVLYWLGRALEGQGKKVDARELYGRVFAVDIRFMDVGERVKALAKAK